MRVGGVDRAVRLAYRAGWLLARSWWAVRRPAHRGALVAVWHDDRLLLLRQSYQRLPTFPGGGVEAGETPQVAAWRELREELGWTVAVEDLIPACVARERFDGRRDTVSFFELRVFRAPVLHIDRREIVAAAFLRPDQWPAALSRPVRHYLHWRAAMEPNALSHRSGPE